METNLGLREPMSHLDRDPARVPCAAEIGMQLGLRARDPLIERSSIFVGREDQAGGVSTVSFISLPKRAPRVRTARAPRDQQVWAP